MISGSARGRRLKAPAGRNIRPTSDRVREALFDLIGPAGPGRRVLDLYAGTGALGIEALSRGAAEAVFVDRDARAVELIQANLSLCGFGDRARVLRLSVQRFLGLGTEAPFDLIVLDPPYALGALEADLDALGRPGWLGEDGRLFAETDAARELDGGIGVLQQVRVKRYGDTRLHEYAVG